MLTQVSAHSLQPALGPADVILGAQPGRFVPEPATPRRESMFGPRGCWARPGGPLLVADSGNHRVLIWNSLPEQDATPPDLVLGQADFTSDARNRGGAPSASSLFVPTGVLLWHERLVVADAWNHRVLIWNSLPSASDTPADGLLGQPDFTSGQINRGGPPEASSCYWPYGLASDGQRLYVADSNNRRVLIWNSLPSASDTPADGLLGQPDFASGEENAGGPPTAASMRWPHALASDGQRLYLADAGNNRVLIWNSLPTRSNAPADRVLGQADFVSVDNNRGWTQPTARSLRFPYAVALWGHWIVVADTGNSRLLFWDSRRTGHDDPPADAVFGQLDFQHNGENRWKLASRETLCWPYGLNAAGGIITVADSGNNRVLLWRAER